MERKFYRPFIILILVLLGGVPASLVALGVGIDYQSLNVSVTATPEVSQPPSPPPSPGGGGGGGDLPTLTVDYSGKLLSQIRINYLGYIQQPLLIVGSKGLFTFEAVYFTRILTAEGTVPEKLEIGIVEEPPTPPEGFVIVGDVDEILPSGLTFDPPAKLVLGVSMADLPQNVPSLSIVYYTFEEGWVMLGTMTAEGSHLTMFAVLAEEAHVSPAAFDLSGLVITPSETTEDKSVVINIEVANYGEETGDCTLELKLDGVVTEVREITLDAGVSEVISFIIEEVKAGEHEVEVSGLCGSFAVVAPLPVPPPQPPAPPTPSPPVTQTPFNLPIIIAVIISAAALAGFIYFIIYRRYRYAAIAYPVKAERPVTPPSPEVTGYPAIDIMGVIDRVLVAAAQSARFTVVSRLVIAGSFMRAGAVAMAGLVDSFFNKLKLKK